MKIRYRGKRSWHKVTYERKSFYFTKVNQKTLEINDQKVINHIFSLGNRTEFEAVVEPPKELEPVTVEKVEVKLLEIKKDKPKKLGRPKKGGK